MLAFKAKSLAFLACFAQNLRKDKKVCFKNTGNGRYVRLERLVGLFDFQKK